MADNVVDGLLVIALRVGVVSIGGGAGGAAFGVIGIAVVAQDLAPLLAVAPVRSGAWVRAIDLAGTAVEGAAS